MLRLPFHICCANPFFSHSLTPALISFFNCSDGRSTPLGDRPQSSAWPQTPRRQESDGASRQDAVTTTLAQRQPELAKRGVWGLLRPLQREHEVPAGPVGGRVWRVAKQREHNIWAEMKYKDDIDPLVLESGIPRSKTFITWRWHSIDELLLGVMRSREWFNAVFEKSKFVQRLGGFFRAGEHHEADFVSLRWSQSNLHYARTARLWMSTILSHEKGLQFLANNRRGKIGTQIAAKLQDELNRLDTEKGSSGWKSRRKRLLRGGGKRGGGNGGGGRRVRGAEKTTGEDGEEEDSSDGEGGWRRPPVLLPGLGSPTRQRSGSGFLDRATSSGNRARGASLDEARRSGSVVGMLASNMMLRGRRPSGNSLSSMVAASADRAWVTQTASPLSRGSLATTLAREWLPIASMLLAAGQVSSKSSEKQRLVQVLVKVGTTDLSLG